MRGRLPCGRSRPDGRTLAAGGSGREGPALAGRRPAHAVRAGAAGGRPGPGRRVHPGGGLLAAGTYAGTVRLWRTRPARACRSAAAARTGTGTGHIFAVAFAPDGRTLAASGTDRTVHLWGVDRAGRTTARRSLTGPGSWVNSPRTRHRRRPRRRQLRRPDLDLGRDHRSARRHAAHTRRRSPRPPSGPAGPSSRPRPRTGCCGCGPCPVLPGARDSVFSVTFGRGGGELAIGSADDSVQLWDLDDPARPVRLGRAAGGPATGASAVSRDGRQLAIGGEDGTVRLWDLRDPRRPVLRPAPLTGLAATVESVAFSPDGRLLAASSKTTTPCPALGRLRPGRRAAGTARCCGAATTSTRSCSPAATTSSPPRPAPTAPSGSGTSPPTRRWPPPSPPPTRTSSRSRSAPTGGRSRPPAATTPSGSGTWPTRTSPRRVGPTLTGPSNYVNALDFGPGNRLAAGSGDGTVWLWDVADAARPVLRATLTGPVGAVFAVGFRPAGDLLAASGADRTVRLWSTDPAGAARRVCAVAGDPITREEWARYVPGLTHAALSRAGLGAPPCPAPDEGRAPLSRAGRRAGHPCPPGRAEGRASRARPVPRLRPGRPRPAPARPWTPACRPPCPEAMWRRGALSLVAPHEGRHRGAPSDSLNVMRDRRIRGRGSSRTPRSSESCGRVRSPGTRRGIRARGRRIAADVAPAPPTRRSTSRISSAHRNPTSA